MPSSRWRTLLGLVMLLGEGAVARATEAPDFATRVVPALTKAGCNAGSCHGAALGRGGFRLSLLGYDPGADYDSLVREYEGRRVDLARPGKSLVLRKPAGELDHGGGDILSHGGEGYRTLRDWVAAGAPRGPDRAVRALEVAPDAATLAATGRSVALRVVAHYDDGTSEDVTRLATYTPSDPGSSRCSPRGEVTALRRGRAVVTVRFLGGVGCATVTVPLRDTPQGGDPRPRANDIDDHVNRTLDELRLDHAPRTDDASLLRRARLDLTGRLPDPEELDGFVADPAPDKHARLVDRLLAITVIGIILLILFVMWLFQQVA